MKIWIFSVVVHLLLLWALSFVVISTPEKPAASVVIQSYSYSPIRAKPEPAVIPEPRSVIETKTPESALSAKKQISKKARVLETTVAIGAIETTSKVKSKSDTKVADTKPAQVTASLPLAERALASVTAKASEPMTEWNQQREVVVRSINPVDTALAPDMFKPVKAFTDGSSLVKAHGVCWRVPPPAAGKNAIWLFAGVSCNDDTKVDQINDILQKRRTYAKD
ncbi:hypothetical protein EMM73_16685 [Rheinheimera sediminis]|uniref:hypothetical protein n=1 Tax=Rheinheimera sp. YQF-1 TaxID=2499626 RepID=UPI000FD8BF08|nr:hypothetical protein [Rheinheimera sp. YQF-1]RVT44453.1 hypothetical protein EMM73_16685 [Rheinheimera sp. YQF-1]